MTKTDSHPPAGPRKRVPLPVVLTVAGVLIVAALFIVRSRTPSGDDQDIPYFTAVEGPLTISVTESGTIEPREKEIIKSGIEGRTTILYLIPEGTRVQKGDLLVELDASDLADQKIDQEIQVQNGESAFIQSRENLEVVKNQAKSDIDDAELRLRFAREDLQQYLEGEYPNALRESEARITLAQEDLRRAEEKLKWSKVLFDEKYLAESELKADELVVKKAQLNVELAENNLDLLKEFTYKRVVAEREAAIRQSEMAMERVTRKASADVVQAEAQLRARESEYKRQTDKLDKIIAQIGKAKIYAPREGLVVYATSARFSWHGNTEPLEAGQEVREQQELIHLPTASTFMATIKIHESNLDKIRVGHPVKITVDALPGQTFSGKVAVIAPLPDPMSMFMNPDLKQFSTEVHIDGGSDVLRTGMSCQNEILIERYEKALYVPVQCVVRVDGKPTVFVKTRSGSEARTVSIGMDNNRMVHVTGGLEAGEEVLLAPPLGSTGINEDKLQPEAAASTEPGAAAPPSARPRERGGDKGAGATDAEKGNMRERLKNMTPEQRAATHARMQGGGGGK